MRVDRAFGFVDLCGFTTFTDIEGDERAVEVLGEFRTIVRATASDRGVRVAKWLGDGAMFVSVDPTELVGAVLDVEQQFDRIQAALPLRGGLSRGEVILFEGDDHIGTAVNLAARLCDLARPHEILATLDFDDLPDDTLTEPAGPVHLPGFSKHVPVVRLRRRGHWAGTAPVPQPA